MAGVVTRAAQAVEEGVGDEAGDDAGGTGGTQPDAKPQAREMVARFGEVEVGDDESSEVGVATHKAQEEAAAQGTTPGAVHATGAEEVHSGKRGQGSHPLVAFPLPDGVAEVGPEGKGTGEVDENGVNGFGKPVHVVHGTVARGISGRLARHRGSRG